MNVYMQTKYTKLQSQLVSHKKEKNRKLIFCVMYIYLPRTTRAHIHKQNLSNKKFESANENIGYIRKSQ